MSSLSVAVHERRHIPIEVYSQVLDQLKRAHRLPAG